MMNSFDFNFNNAACSALSWLSVTSLSTQNKLGPSGADFQVGGFVYVLGPCGSVQWTLLWGWEFLLSLQSPHIFSVSGFKALFPHAITLGCVVCISPQFFLPVNPHANVGLPGPPAATLPWVLSALAAHLYPSYQSGWMFLLQLLGCWTFIQCIFLAVLAIF